MSHPSIPPLRPVPTLILLAGLATLAAAGDGPAPSAGGVMLPGTMAVEQSRLAASDGAAQDVFGNAIDLDGETAVIAAPWDRDDGDFSGSVYVFTRKNGSWQQEAKLRPADGAPYGLFGYDVALDGDTCVVGALGRAPDWGAVYVFVRRDGLWTEQAKLLPFDGGDVDYLGHSVAVDGDTVLVGAPDWNHALAPGAAYVFTRDGESWTQQAKLELAGIRAGHKFGHEVALDGDTAVIGAHGIGPDYKGRVHLFEREEGVWAPAVSLELTPGAVNDYFGFGLDLDGPTLMVGAPFDAVDGEAAGAVHVWEHADGFWTRTSTLRPADGASPSWFGKNVSLDGDLALIGAPYDDDNGFWSGSAYVFGRTSDGDWVEVAKLLPADGAAEQSFGFGLALDHGIAVVGEPWGGSGPAEARVYAVRGGRGASPAGGLRPR